MLLLGCIVTPKVKNIFVVLGKSSVHVVYHEKNRQYIVKERLRSWYHKNISTTSCFIRITAMVAATYNK
jgi:hypothetical protein